MPCVRLTETEQEGNGRSKVLGVYCTRERAGWEKNKKKHLRVILKEQKHVCLFNDGVGS